VAEVSQLRDIFLTQRANIRTVPKNLTFGGRKQSAQDAQETGLAAAVRAGELDESAG